jgi:coenzyme F420-0:L-glutamate ligase/coenzyme F420-1:gamma-L-glutamate ligase
VTIAIEPVPGLPEILAGDDLAGLILDALDRAGMALRSGDVLAVTQKVVSKAEGRVVPEADGPGKAGWVERETRRVVARRDELVVAETRHGFVCANAGVDASNVAEGFVTLLPEDPDGSAARIRADVAERTGVDVGVVVTDTFGRPWRNGLVNVAIGCAGLPSVVDLRGQADAGGRVLEATIEALADEIAAAGGLVMGKADGVPVAVLRGVRAPEGAPEQPAAALVRPSEMDLFRESAMQSIHALRQAERFSPATVERERIAEAVAAACMVTTPSGGRPWLFVALWQGPARGRLRETLGSDLIDDGPAVVVPFVRTGDEEAFEELLVAGGGAVEALRLALRAQGLGSRWIASRAAAGEPVRSALGVAEGWTPLGAVTVGLTDESEQPNEPEQERGLEEFVRYVDESP